MANLMQIYIYVILYMYTCYCYTYEWHYLNGAFYGLSLEQESHNKAQLACQHEGAELATVVTLTEHSFLNYIMTYSDYWIGLQYNQTHYYWSNGEILNPVLWYPGDPNDFSACLRYLYEPTQQEYLLVDDVCNTEYRFICQKQHVLRNIKTAFGKAMTKEDLYNFATFWALANKSRTQCAVECLNEIQCLAFGHHSSTHECRLYQWTEQLVVWSVDESFHYFRLERLM